MSADGGLRAILHKGLRAQGLLCTAIETGSTAAGVPDTYWASRATKLSGWIECKATDGWAVTLRPHQLGWLSTHSAAGVRTALAVWGLGKGSGGAGRSALWLLDGGAADALASVGLSAVTPQAVWGIWGGPPRAWPWAEVAAALLGRDG